MRTIRFMEADGFLSGGKLKWCGGRLGAGSYPQAESNCHPALRRGMHYPLCYAGTAGIESISLGDYSQRTVLKAHQSSRKQKIRLKNLLWREKAELSRLPAIAHARPEIKQISGMSIVSASLPAGETFIGIM